MKIPRHPDGTPYWEPTPIVSLAEAQMDYSLSTGELLTKGGSYMGTFPNITAAGMEYLDAVINTIY